MSKEELQVSPQLAFDPRHDLHGVEGLRDIIVRADVEAEDLIRVLAFRREQNDGDVARSAQPRQCFDPVHTGHHDVQQHELNVFLNFVRMDRTDWFGTHTITDCYYKDAYGKAQGTQVSSEELADGTTTAALNSNRTGDDAPWIQDPVTHLPMLKSFVSKNSGISTGEAIQVHSSKFIVQSESWYSISGQKLSGKPTAKGIYIRNGKKIIVK